MKATERRKEVPLEPCGGVCVVCGTHTNAFYGRWGKAGTCSKKCEEIQAKKAHDAYLDFAQARLAVNVRNECAGLKK